jgi:hypothetical protein
VTGSARTHAAALAVTSETADAGEQARADNGLASCYYATGDPSQALSHWRMALALYTHLGAPEADQVREQLAVVGAVAGSPRQRFAGDA